jgi:hypothetical protein
VCSSDLSSSEKYSRTLVRIFHSMSLPKDYRRSSKS